MKSDLEEFASSLTLETIEHVFLRFPKNGKTRAIVYRKISNMLQEIAVDLMLEDV